MKRISPQATKSTHKQYSIIDKKLIDLKSEHSSKNERLREIHNFHERDDATLHRMLNAIQPKSYIMPHRHLDDPKEETIVILKGSLGCLCFDDDGKVIPDSMGYLSHESGQFGIDLRVGVFHTIFALEPNTVVFEVKSGPYKKASDKEFASWAPNYGSNKALEYLADLEDRLRKKFHLEKRIWTF